LPHAQIPMLAADGMGDFYRNHSRICGVTSGAVPRDRSPDCAPGAFPFELRQKLQLQAGCRQGKRNRPAPAGTPSAGQHNRDTALTSTVVTSTFAAVAELRSITGICSGTSRRSEANLRSLTLVPGANCRLVHAPSFATGVTRICCRKQLTRQVRYLDPSPSETPPILC